MGYNFLYLMLLRTPVCLMTLSVCINLFLSLLVGSLLMICMCWCHIVEPVLCWCSPVHP